MTGFGHLGEAILWRVLGRSHFFLLAVAAISIPYWPIRSFGNGIPHGDIGDSILWSVHVLFINDNINFLLFAACCYVLREILRLVAARQDGSAVIPFELRESKVEIIMNLWIEKAFMALVFLFLALATYDAAVALWNFAESGFSWRYQIMRSIGSVGTKLFYATVLFFLSMLLSMLRARGEDS